MSKSRKRLGQDLKESDVLLLDRPEVEIIRDVTDEKKDLRRKPKGRFLLVKEKKSKQEYEIYVGANEKMDCTYRPSMWDRFKKWLDSNHKTYHKAPPPLKASRNIPPIFQDKTD
jgi:hypothetical protein